MLLGICFIASQTYAQQQNAVSPDSVKKNIELPVARIQTFKEQLLDESQGKTIPLGFIKRNNQAQDLPYMLNTLTGVVVSSDAGTGTGYTDIRVRGTDLTRINVTMNGVPVNDPESQATYFVNTPDLLSSATGLELQRGVGQSKNGNASFGASISINNLDVLEDKPGVKYNVDFGRFNTQKHTLKMTSGLLHNKCVTSLRLSSITSDGYIDRSSSDLKGLQWTTKYSFNPHTQMTFNYVKGKEKTGQAWNGVSEDSLSTNRQFNELGLMPNGEYYKNQTDNYGQDYYQLFIDHTVNQHISIGSTLFYTKGKGYYEEYKMDQAFSNYGLPNYIQGNDTFETTHLIRQLWLDNDFYGGRLYATYVSSAFDAGLYLNYNEYKGNHHGDVIWSYYPIDHNYRWYNLNAQKNDLNVYGMVDYRFSSKFSLLADAQLRKVDYTLNGFRNNPSLHHDLQWLFFNPKLSLTYKDEHQRIVFSSGLSNKEPNRDDIEAGANEIPKHESLWDTELQYSYSGNSHWAFHLTAYHMQYNNQLVLTGKINDVGAYTRSNIAKSYRRGIEIEGIWRSPNRWLEAKLNVALSENKINHFIEYIDDYDQGGQLKNEYHLTDISFSPGMIAGGAISIFPLRTSSHSSIKELSMDILPKYVSQQYLDNTSNKQRSIPAYFTNDVMLQCPILLNAKQEFRLRLGVYNIFNTLYESKGYTFSYQEGGQLRTYNYYYPQAGIRWMIGLGVSF